MNETLLAVLAIVASVLSTASIILHIVAPRTKATWDDKLSARLDEVLGIVRTIQPKPTEPPTVAKAIGTGGPITLVALLLGGLLAIALQPSCTWQEVKTKSAAGGHAIVECAKADAEPILLLAGQLAAQALIAQLDQGSIDWPAVEEAAATQGKVVGGCALTRFVAALKQAPRSDTAARALVAPPDPAADGRVALARLSRRFEGATWQ